MEIVKGVYQIKLPLPGGPPDHTNAYLIDGSEGNLLIDTGWNTPEAFSALGEELKSNGFDFSDISQIVITHLHPDHYGLAGRIRELSGAKLALSEIEARLLDRRYVNMSILVEEVSHLLRAHGTPQSELSQLSQASMPVRELVIPAKPDIKLKAGQKVSMNPFEFKALLTPGHSPGHICLYEPERKFLFTGDHILPDITPNVGLHPQSGANPLGDYINSLKSLTELEVSFVFPGHGSVFSGLGQRIDVLLRHHQQRMTDILNVIRDDPKTAYQIATEIPWVPDDGGINFQDLPPLDKRLAVLETLAHLQLLATEGKTNKVVKERTNFYRATSGR
jgi:glyoxylase-like metal-dependent hydrolase (beta-lactamase superfamily II)